jgi:hypothetical protein
MDDTAQKLSFIPKGPTLTGKMRLYTDAAILRSLADDVSPTNAIRSLEILDRAIIVCGIAGGRLDMILSLIVTIQRHCFPTPSPTFTVNAVSQPLRRDLRLLSSRHKIVCFSESPSLVTFQSNLAKGPFIIRGYAQDWPAIREHPWRSAAYLRFISGPGRIVPVEVGKDYRADGWTQKLMPWDDFLSTLDLLDQNPQQCTECYYLAQHNLFTQFPALRDDIVIPDYVYSSLTSRDFPMYRPPGNDEQLVLNTWVGPEGTVSPAHTVGFIFHFSIYSFNHRNLGSLLQHIRYLQSTFLFMAVADWCPVQVVGQKTVWLAPPTVSGVMYPYSSAKSDDPAADKTHSSMGTTSRVDVFSRTDACKGDFSDFWDHVVPAALHETLESGDLLFLPPGWWHSMRAESSSFSLSMWF